MVVEILEEKLDREYCDNAAKLMLKAIGKGLIGAFSDDDFDDRDGDHSGAVKSIKEEVSSILELPKTWEPMTNKEVNYSQATVSEKCSIGISCEKIYSHLKVAEC